VLTCYEITGLTLLSFNSDRSQARKDSPSLWFHTESGVSPLEGTQHVFLVFIWPTGHISVERITSLYVREVLLDVDCCLIRHSPVVSFVLHVLNPHTSLELRYTESSPAAKMLVGEGELVCL
jgi:hypothetical protein